MRRRWERSAPQVRKPIRLLWLHVGALCRIPKSSDPKAVWMVVAHSGKFLWSPVELSAQGRDVVTWRASDLKPILLDGDGLDDDDNCPADATNDSPDDEGD
jgi:hypothetical protein